MKKLLLVVLFVLVGCASAEKEEMVLETQLANQGITIQKDHQQNEKEREFEN